MLNSDKLDDIVVRRNLTGLFFLPEVADLVVFAVGTIST